MRWIQICNSKLRVNTAHISRYEPAEWYSIPEPRRPRSNALFVQVDYKKDMDIWRKDNKMIQGYRIWVDNTMYDTLENPEGEVEDETLKHD